jgi:hypothetical protein
MRAPLVVRLSGWAITLLGGALILVSFANDDVPRAQNPFFMAGAVVFVLGMILTSASGLLATLQRRREITERLDQHKSSRSGPPPPPG